VGATAEDTHHRDKAKSLSLKNPSDGFWRVKNASQAETRNGHPLPTIKIFFGLGSGAPVPHPNGNKIKKEASRFWRAGKKRLNKAIF
jgi:hypothetical protein